MSLGKCLKSVVWKRHHVSCILRLQIYEIYANCTCISDKNKEDAQTLFTKSSIKTLNVQHACQYVA